MQQQIQSQIQMQQAFNFGNFTIDGKMYNATNDFSSLYGNMSSGNMTLGNMSLGNMTSGNDSTTNGSMSFGNMTYGNMSYQNYTQSVQNITIEFFFDSFNSQPQFKKHFNGSTLNQNNTADIGSFLDFSDAPATCKTCMDGFFFDSTDSSCKLC